MELNNKFEGLIMTIKEQYKLPTDTTCFYSIKLGDMKFRQDCIETNKIAINFGMTETRHQELMKLRQNEADFRKFLKIENNGKSIYVENQHHHFYRPELNAVWLTVDKGFLYYAEEVDTMPEMVFGLIPEGWVLRNVKNWQKVPTPVCKLPGIIRNLSVQRQTIIEIPFLQKPKLFELIKNVINQEKPLVNAYRETFKDRDKQIQCLIQQLDPADFETLIDLILHRMTYTRESILGGQEKDFDGIYKDLRSATDTLYVQVKCASSKKELMDFISAYTELKKTDPYAKGLFAFHTANSLGTNQTDPDSQIWDIDVVSNHVIRLGLENWILDRVYA